MDKIGILAFGPSVPAQTQSAGDALLQSIERAGGRDKSGDQIGFTDAQTGRLQAAVMPPSR
ncbi:hypothetical protein [Gluconacetobacter sp.]|uniref:hypothetical protein n=1 Tax=Gluconacetobacter sp. TaxID=1935994 RepID=UPI0039EAD45E